MKPNSTPPLPFSIKMPSVPPSALRTPNTVTDQSTAKQVTFSETLHTVISRSHYGDSSGSGSSSSSDGGSDRKCALVACSSTPLLRNPEHQKYEHSSSKKSTPADCKRLVSTLDENFIFFKNQSISDQQIRNKTQKLMLPLTSLLMCQGLQYQINEKKQHWSDQYITIVTEILAEQFAQIEKLQQQKTANKQEYAQRQEIADDLSTDRARLQFRAASLAQQSCTPSSSPPKTFNNVDLTSPSSSTDSWIHNPSQSDSSHSEHEQRSSPPTSSDDSAELSKLYDKMNRS